MDFLCGVVEGFYGIPWMFTERQNLLQRMKELKLNTYVYGPKDDKKHRKDWRLLYDEKEQEKLGALISEAKTNSVEFVYSISPGLDVVFSSSTDDKCLLDKLQQVYSLGCRSFAIFFDDIPPELCLADKTEFNSFGEAQALLINKMYEALDNKNVMIMCPTEYCGTRAKPNVSSSEYLKTLGKLLHKDIHIMWTGPKVVSEEISVSSVKEVSDVLQRKPVIWDNIHANDYDQRRLFLGPFKGRPVELYSSIAGVFTNPNCEYECNFIAIHLISSWVEACRSGDTEMLTSALQSAITDWLKLFRLKRDVIVDSEFAQTNLIDITNTNPVQCNDDEANEGSSSSPSASSSCVQPCDVSLLCDLFYLPYEHGQQGIEIIQRFNWLKHNAPDYTHTVDPVKDEEWRREAASFNEISDRVQQMFDRMSSMPNRRLLQQLHPYIYDAKESVNVLKHFVKWLGSEKRKENSEGFLPSDPEPWYTRGGITQEFQNLIPIPRCGDEDKIQIIRPYSEHDKTELYNLCRLLSPSPEVYATYPNLLGDSEIGAFLHLSPENVFVVEENDSINSCCALHKSTSAFYQQRNDIWLPMVRNNYKKPGANPTTWSVEEEAVNRLYNSRDQFPAEDCGILILKTATQDVRILKKLLKVAVGRQATSFVTRVENEAKQKLFEELGFVKLKGNNLSAHWYKFQSGFS